MGGALRDELLGRPVVDVDVACRTPSVPRARSRAAAAGAVSALRAPRRLADGARRTGGRSTSRRCRAPIEEDLAARDFTLNAIARPLEGGELVDPVRRRATSPSARSAPSPEAFSTPTRYACCAPSVSRTSSASASTRRRRRSSASTRSSPRARRRADPRRARAALDAGYRRLEELGLLEPWAARRTVRPVDPPTHPITGWCAFGEQLQRLHLAAPRRLRRRCSRAEPPADGSPRAIHRFRRSTEPWALDALAFLGAAELPGGRAGARRRSRRAAPARRRARPAAGPRGRAAARADRRGARRWHYLDERGGAGACPTRAAEATQARFAASAERMAELEERRREALRAQSAAFSSRPATSASSTRARAPVACLRPRAARRGGSRRRRCAGSARGGTARASRRSRTSPSSRATPRAFPSRTDRSTSPQRAHAAPRPAPGARRRRARAGDRLRRAGAVIDQIAPIDPLPAFELDRFERARDPSHTRLLPDVDIRSLLDANGLVSSRGAVPRRTRDVDGYLDLAGCEGESGSALVRRPGELHGHVGWYLAAPREPAVGSARCEPQAPAQLADSRSRRRERPARSDRHRRRLPRRGGDGARDRGRRLPARRALRRRRRTSTRT